MWFWISKIGKFWRWLRDKISWKSPYFWAFACLAVGVWMYWYFPEPGGLGRTIANLLIGVGIVQLLFEMEFRKNLQKNLSGLRKNAKELHKDVSELHHTIQVTKGAVESGLVGIFATRKDCMEEIERKLKEVLGSVKRYKPTEKKIEVFLLGTCLGDFLGPNGTLWHTFQKVLGHTAFKIRLAILDDGCKAACCRARVEEYSRYEDWDPNRKKCLDCTEPLPCLGMYENAACHTELETSMVCLRKLSKNRPIEPDGLQPTCVMKADLEAYMYRILPTILMFRMDDDMFVEQYHLGRRGGQTPILHMQKRRSDEDTKESRLFKIYMDHFESVRKMSKKIKLGVATETAWLSRQAQAS